MSFLRTLPDWRVSLVWRLYGWAGIQEILVLKGPRPWTGFLANTPWVLDLFAACSVLLVLVGPRPALLTVTGAAAGGVLWLMASGTSPQLNFPGAEMPLFAALPLGTVLLWTLARLRAADDEELARSLLGLCRIVFFVEMAFVALHKANHDFFDPDLSCARALNTMLPQWWDSSFAELARLLEPPVVLAFEGAIPLLALLYWPLGLLVAITFFVGLAMLGPTGFTAVSIAAAFGFVRGTTAADLFRLPRRWPLAFVVAAGGLVAYIAWTYRGPPAYPWPQFALYAVVAGFLVACLLDEFARDLLRRRATGLASTLSLSWPRSGLLRTALVAIALVGIVNGLMPYFGYRYHFSFSMLSNLRADAIRWNSYVVPQWFRLVDEDPFVRVKRVRILREGGRKTDPDKELFEAYFPPYEFGHRVRYHLHYGHEVTVWIEYQGESRVLRRIGSNADARAFVKSLPRDRLFQKVLVDGPQACVH